MVAKPEYNTIISRGIAQTSCFVGMLQLLVGISTVICSFAIYGGFCDQLHCQDITDAIGLWLGFPLLIPALIGVVILGTRHRLSALSSAFTNFVVIIIAIVHTIITNRDDTDVWSKHVEAYNKNKCSVEFPMKCLCVIDGKRKRLPYGCDLIEAGSNLNWVLFGMSIASIFLCAMAIALNVIGIYRLTVKPQKR